MNKADSSTVPDDPGHQLLMANLREKIRVLESAGTGEPDHISLYVPHAKEIRDAIGHLSGEMDLAESMDDEEIRARVQRSLSSMRDRLRSLARIPPNGLACFSGPDLSGTGSPDTGSIVFEPPEPVLMYLYRRSTRFELDPLRQMLDEKTLVGLIVIDQDAASWGVLRNGLIEHTGSATSNVPGRHHKGGQSAARFQRLHEIALLEFCQRVGELAGTDFRKAGDLTRQFQGIVIGGRSPAREELAAGEYLHHELRGRILGSFDVSRIDREGLRILSGHAKDVIRTVDEKNDTTVVDRFIREVERDTGFAIFGEAGIRKHLAAGAVGTLLLSSALRRDRQEITCEKCGHSDKRTIRLGPEDTVEKILAHTCYVCNAPIIVDGKPDLMEELAALADLSGTKTILISQDTYGGERFLKTYGGAGALLRYRE